MTNKYKVLMAVGFTVSWSTISSIFFVQGLGVVPPDIFHLILLILGFCAGLGLILFIVGLSKFVKNINNKKLLATGMRITTDIIDIYCDRSFQINSRSPYVIESRWTDPSTQKMYIFKSPHIWMNPNFLIGDKKKIDVLIAPLNPEHYYVDLFSVGIDESKSSKKINIFLLFLVIGIILLTTIGFSFWKTFVNNLQNNIIRSTSQNSSGFEKINRSL